MLNLYNFPIHLKNLIISCVTISSISIIFNGEELNSFTPSKGLRQGDPLSPHIFILYMEFLSFLIQKVVNEGKWKPTPAQRASPSFSQFLFANELILIATASSKNAQIIKEILDQFYSILGLKAYSEKSRIFFSSNTDPQIQQAISTFLNFEKN